MPLHKAQIKNHNLVFFKFIFFPERYYFSSAKQIVVDMIFALKEYTHFLEFNGKVVWRLSFMKKQMTILTNEKIAKNFVTIIFIL